MDKLKSMLEIAAQDFQDNPFIVNNILKNGFTLSDIDEVLDEEWDKLDRRVKHFLISIWNEMVDMDEDDIMKTDGLTSEAKKHQIGCLKELRKYQDEYDNRY